MNTKVKMWWHIIESYLDATAMYRTVTLALAFLVLVSVTFGFSGLIAQTGLEQVLSVLAALGTALAVNYGCSRVCKVAVNMESAVITALIIFFLVMPAQLSSLADSFVIMVVVSLAIVSKFVLAWKQQHVANPAAVGLLLMALAYEIFPIPGYFESTWWIGQPIFFIPLLLAGVAVVAKVRKWVPVTLFLLTACFVFLLEEWRFYGQVDGGSFSIISSLSTFWLSGPALFLAFFMLTEPFSMPPTKKLQAVYGVAVGFISQTTLFLPLQIKMTPELALVLGNLLFYPFSLRQKLNLTLVSKEEVAHSTIEFAFKKPHGVHFKAGQYMEWMLPHSSPDNRGIRRYFTIASSPTDTLLRVTVRFGEKISTFKQALLALKPGAKIIASQRAGDFVLPNHTSAKIALVAGGIGITPFISQLAWQQASDGEKFNSILFYCNNTLADTAYRDWLQAATHTLPLTVVHVLAKDTVPGYETGYLTEAMIKKYAPDYLERLWYLSGPPGMVHAYSHLLQTMGVSKLRIKRDFFPGLV